MTPMRVKRQLPLVLSFTTWVLGINSDIRMGGQQVLVSTEPPHLLIFLKDLISTFPTNLSLLYPFQPLQLAKVNYCLI